MSNSLSAAAAPHADKAAPDLLIALENLVELCELVFTKPAECDDLDAARAAIAKAWGR